MFRLATGLTVALAGCGRLGFVPAVPDDAAVAPDDGAVNKPDGQGSTVDAPTIDAAPGTGSYLVTQTTAPYTLLTGTAFPGFAAGVSDDDNFPLTLPFTFTFYGRAFTQLAVNVNGFVTFEFPPTGTETYMNECPFDPTTPNATIAVFWDDLTALTKAPPGAMSYLFDGTSPDRRLTVEWRDLDAYYQQNANNAFQSNLRVTEQLVLHETGTIEMHYGPRTAPTVTKDCGIDRHRGCSATVGLEGPAGSPTQMVQCGTAAGPMAGYTPIDDGRLITYVPQ